MKSWPVGWFAVLSLLSMFASSGCSDSPDGDPAAALASCNAFCEAYLTAKCADYPTLDDCKSSECADLPRQPIGCQTQIKSYYDCREAKAVVCIDPMNPADPCFAICINPDDPTDDCFAEFHDLLTCSSA